MALTGIHVGDYGFPIRLRCTEDGAAADISAFTTLQYLFSGPADTVTTVTASFNADGADGVLTYTVAQNLFTAAGDWQVQAKLSRTGQVVHSEILHFNVERVLG